MGGRRVSGILLHPTSLPGPGQTGTLGPRAYRFLDELVEAGQGLWQVLPLGPTGYGDSPYQAFSAFAGNPLLISPELLAEDDLLDFVADNEVPERVDYGAAIDRAGVYLAEAFQRFRAGHGPADLARELDEFRSTNEGWLREYALFAAIHEHEKKSWVEWPEEISNRDPAALAKARDVYREEIAHIEFSQMMFFRQWLALRSAANEKGIEILGDMPIFVSHDSADVWANRKFFDLDDSGNPRILAGAPPDAFSEDGQLWGNPLYQWDRLEENRFSWWVDRVRASFGLFDRLRLDHFLGFDACWGTPAGETKASAGGWIPVPGAKLFEALREQLGTLPLVAEDLGMCTPAVYELRDRFGFPGMRILQFAFGDDPAKNPFMPHNHIRNCVVYTGTHDTETIQGWFRHGTPTRDRTDAEANEERRRILACTGGDGSEIHWDLIRLALMSVADTAVIPMQDVLGLGNGARMNSPGKPSGNWGWRLDETTWTPEVRSRLADLSRATAR